ncbi:MAG TPA: serine/threonine-protein kinase [Polyangia bacterium]|nr:serine/threonine-protein kinase [Polyangia bacterium]
MPPRPLTTADAPTPDGVALGGPRIIDRYQIVAVIGRGATGSVYRAIDLRLGRTVALKTATGSRDGARLTDRVRQRFLREAMALSKVDQRNVVQVLDYGFADDGTPFLVMEHLRGRDLGAVLALAELPLPVDEVADMGLGVCAALRACHRVGIIHRDLKAANVFLVDTDTGTEIKVLDFGVSNAAAADDRTRAAQVTAPPHHLAPEQIDGKVGPASDQFALGVLLYFCLTRQFPQRLRGARSAVKPANLPPALDAVLARATRLAPAERFESVYALGRELLEFASQRGQAQWRRYYQPEAAAHPSWSGAPAPPNATTRLRAAGPGACTTSVDAARAVTATKVSRRAGRDARAGGLGAVVVARMGGGWPLRAASIGCVALAAAGLASGRRRPPKPVPAAAARRGAPVEAGVEAARPPRHALRPQRPKPEPPAPAPTVVEAALRPLPVPSQGSLLVDSPAALPPATRRVKPHAPSPPPLPNIDSAGIGIPTD